MTSRLDLLLYKTRCLVAEHGALRYRSEFGKAMNYNTDFKPNRQIVSKFYVKQMHYSLSFPILDWHERINFANDKVMVVYLTSK